MHSNISRSQRGDSQYGNKTGNSGTSNDAEVGSLSIDNVNILSEMSCPIGSTSVSYTDDLRLIAVGQENGSVQLFENGNPTKLLYDSEMMGEAEPCTDIKIRSSPKNGFHKSLLVTYLGGHIKLWDTKIGKCLFTMKENRQIYGVNYHPKNSKFLTFGNDPKIYIYNEERRVTERILAGREVVGGPENGHTNSVCCAKFHPGNSFEIISSGLDGTIQFWDLRAPHAVRHIPGVVNFGEALDISPDGKRILAGVSRSPNCTLTIYDYATGAKLSEGHFSNSHVYVCKFLTPVYIGVGGFSENSFRVVNVEAGKVLGFLGGLPGCVMSFASKQKVPRQRVHNKKIPGVVICSAGKVYEIETVSPSID